MAFLLSCGGGGFGHHLFFFFFLCPLPPPFPTPLPPHLSVELLVRVVNPGVTHDPPSPASSPIPGSFTHPLACVVTPHAQTRPLSSP